MHIYMYVSYCLLPILSWSMYAYCSLPIHIHTYIYIYMLLIANSSTYPAYCLCVHLAVPLCSWCCFPLLTRPPPTVSARSGVPGTG